MQKIFSIAIDGPAGAGKSTIAKILAKEMDALYLDTGAMYRTIGLYMLRNEININDPAEIAAHVNEADVTVGYVNGAQRTYLAGEDVSLAIRTPDASMAASKVSAVPEVRARMVSLQQKIAEGISVIMDGRDIGTHVLPNATLKVYLTASPEVRAYRRYLELKERGGDQPYETVLAEIVDRDYYDMHREASPLRPAEDARRVDCSDLTAAEVAGLIRSMAEKVIGG